MRKKRRQRILLVTRNLPPLVGGMERLNWHMAEEFGRRAEVKVIAPVGAAACAPPGVTVYEAPLRPLWRFLARATWDSVRIALKWAPDVVLAGSGLTALPAWLAARAARARAAAYVHGLDLAVSQPIYRALWLPALRNMDAIVANSRATSGLAEQAGISVSRISIVHPGVQLPDSIRDHDAVEHFRTDQGLSDRPILLSVGRLSTRKGLLEFVERALPSIVAAVPKAVLLIIGDVPGDALQASAQSPQSIRQAAEVRGLADHVRFLGQISDYGLLGLAYRAANLHVFPVRELPGDPEGFGMVAVEAAAHGLPTVAFATGGVSDAVGHLESGCLVKPGDYPGLAVAIIEMLGKKPGAYADSCRGFAGQFAWSIFGEKVAAAVLGSDVALARDGDDRAA